MSLAQAFAPLVDLFYPPRCPLCGAGIAEQNGLCASCWAELVIPGQPACASCQRPMADTAAGEGAQCAPCMARLPRHGGIAAGTLYTDPARRLVLAFKHGGRIALAPMMARLIAARLPDLEGVWTVVPVPLHRHRLWRRGYNQSALLAREIARLRRLGLLVDGLRRIRATPSLGGLGRLERQKALKGAIIVNPRRAAAIAGANVLLVDDVMTSGATTDACIGALRAAGAVQVRIACFSRVLHEVA